MSFSAGNRDCRRALSHRGRPVAHRARAGSATQPAHRRDGGSERPERRCGGDPLAMAVSVVMPALEMAQETGKLLAWLKKEGEPVKKGEPLLEIETDKVTVEVEAPADGVLAALKAREGTDVPVGQTIAWIV